MRFLINDYARPAYNFVQMLLCNRPCSPFPPRKFVPRRNLKLRETTKTHKRVDESRARIVHRAERDFAKVDLAVAKSQKRFALE